MTRVDARRLALKRLHRASARTSMLNCLHFSKRMIIPLLRARKPKIESVFTLLDALGAKSVVELGHGDVKKCGGSRSKDKIRHGFTPIYGDSNNFSERI